MEPQSFQVIMGSKVANFLELSTKMLLRNIQRSRDLMKIYPLIELGMEFSQNGLDKWGRRCGLNGSSRLQFTFRSPERTRAIQKFADLFQESI